MSELKFFNREEPRTVLMPGCALRLQLVELAIQGGATIENALKVAVDWERWIHEAADPIRLDVPSPVVGESKEHKIDWHFNGDQYLTHTPSGTTSAYAGRHKEGVFYGSRLGSGVWGWVSKNGFRQGAGLHDEPKNPGKKELGIDWSRPHW